MPTAADLIKKLIQGPESYQEINGSFLEGFPVNREEYWQKLLEFLKTESAAGHLGHMPILESDFPNNVDSLFEFINNNADLSDQILRNLKQNFETHGIDETAASGLGDNSDDYFWNESMSKALSIFLGYFDVNFQSYRPVEMEEEPQDWHETYTFYYIKVNNEYVQNESGHWDPDITYYLPDDGLGYLSVSFLKKADAGKSFTGIPYVLPWYNIDGRNYIQVRGADKIDSVLQNSNQLQYTRSLNSGWIRLLMPKYLRKVEVEDLNRNFWVISTVLGSICNFLFGDDPPFKDMFDSILKELVQLWENVLYLWATLALISQKQSTTKVHTEVLPIANNEFQSYIKFDNFDRPELDLENLQPRIQYIIDTYTDSNICILVQVRDNNYKHNYYSKEIYPGFIFYNRNTETSSFLPIKNGVDFQIVTNAAAMFTAQYKNSIGTLKENELTYEYMTPTTDATYQNEPYYIILRSVPEVTASYGENGIQIDSFSLKVYDVATIIKDNPTIAIPFMTYEKPENDNWNSSMAELGQSVEASSTSYLPSKAPSYVSFDIQKGFYLGELTSYCCALDAPTWRFNTDTVQTIPFIIDNDNLIPVETAFETGTTSGITFDTDIAAQAEDVANINSAINSNTDIVELYAIDMIHDSDEFHLIKTNHKSILKGNDGNSWHYTEIETYVDASDPPSDWGTAHYYYKNQSGKYVLAEGAFQPNKVYYKLISSTTDLPISSYSTFKSQFGYGGVLYNPITLQQIVYPEYEYFENFVAWDDAPAALSDGVFTEKYYDIYLTDDNRIMTNNNWIVKLTEVVFAAMPHNVRAPAYEDYYSGIVKSISGVNYNTIVQRITTHLFYADGTYARRVYDRANEYPDRIIATGTNILGNTWSLLYNNKNQYNSFLVAKDSYQCLKAAEKDFDSYLNTGNSSAEFNVETLHPKTIIEEGA